jgi:phospholipase/carboxylesterase
MKNTELGFIHRFIPTNSKSKQTDLTILLLHGTGGNEEDLIPFGKELASNASILSVRGKVLENGMPRFFRRIKEGVFDLEDLNLRTNELADFILNSSSIYEYDLERIIAVGFSNGANIGASLLLRRPEILTGAILFRSMVPFIRKVLPDLSKKHILLSEGLHDPIISRGEAEKLLRLLTSTHSDATLEWQDSGHNLVQQDIVASRRWLERNF